jgi:hypothetical protein
MGVTVFPKSDRRIERDSLNSAQAELERGTQGCDCPLAPQFERAIQARGRHVSADFPQSA